MGKGDLQSEFQKMKEETAFLDTLILVKNQRSLDSVEIRAAAFSIISIYNGIEKVLLATLGPDNTQSSATWHSDLLTSSRSRGLISEELYDHLASFLGFRHFIRHAYSFEIRTEPVEAILDTVKKIVQQFMDELK